MKQTKRALLIATALCSFVATPAVAQDAELQVETGTDGMPQWQSFDQNHDFLRAHRERGGIQLGLALKEQARAQGTPFEAMQLSDLGRPEFAAEVAIRGRNVLIIRDTDGSIQRNGFASRQSQQTWQEVLRIVIGTYGDSFDMVMSMTEWQERFGAYYLPLSNDVRGLGYQHLSGQQIFDQTGTKLQGLIAMNSYRTYLGNQGQVYGRIVFLQEIGHRWGAFVWYGNGPGNGRDMLGRDDSHWSYFMDSGNSALEGNAWQDNRNGSFTTETNAFQLSFGELDLYLMGMLPKNEVDPWFVIRDVDTRGQRDDYGAALNPASPPAYGGRTTVNGERGNITIDDVITAEGDRSPGASQSQKEWKVATVLIISSNSNFGESGLNSVEAMLDFWESLFDNGTRGAGDLDLTLEEGQRGTQGYGESCETAADCNPAEATTCLNTDDGRVCSKRCQEESECGGNDCCTFNFCYPGGDSQCEEANNGANNGGNNGGNNGANNGGNNGANNGGNNGANNGGNNGANNGGGSNNGFTNNGAGNNGGCEGFTEDCNDSGFVDGRGTAAESCATTPGSPSPAAPLAFLALVGLVALHRLRN